jgi:GT2 family glycosyltransferase
MNDAGIVIIGRNEGERLRGCLSSVVRRGLPVVYVDSNSTDGSVALARALGVEVVELDPSGPLNPSRGRNAGFARLKEIDPELRLVQFIDGDCELVAGWLERAIEVLESRPDVGAVCGRRRERFPERSIYNRLADLDWDTPIGEAKSCGGDVMMRATAFRQIGGYDPDLITGEDPDLSVRLRKNGWTILRVDVEMTVHDIALVRFGQWWRRSLRTGYCYADGAQRHGKPPERHFVREVRSIFFWGIALPLAILVLAWPTRGASLALLGAYLLLYWRIRRYGSRRGWSARDARLYALWCILGKVPMVVGLFVYWFRRVARRPERYIDYIEARTVTAAGRPHSKRL